MYFYMLYTEKEHNKRKCYGNGNNRYIYMNPSCGIKRFFVEYGMNLLLIWSLALPFIEHALEKNVIIFKINGLHKATTRESANF